jgi:hypothetical protein
LLDLLDGEDWWVRLNPLIASADAHLDEGLRHVATGSNEDNCPSWILNERRNWGMSARSVST